VSIEANALEQERSRDLILETPDGQVIFTVRYASPKLLESWKRRVIGQGICRKDLEVAPGRFKDFCRSVAETFVIGWQGIKAGGNDAPCSVELMASILENRGDVYKLLNESIGEDSAFFGRNGRSLTQS